MASIVYNPRFKAWVPVTGVPASDYSLRTYAAGTTTNQAVFTDAACTIPAANPVVLDSNGEATLYAVAGTLYKFALYDPTNTVLQAGWPVDSITIYGGGTGGGGTSSVSEWVPSGLVPAYISGTSFSFPAAAGNVTSTYTPGRVLQTTNTSGTVYSTITASSFGTFTTVTVTPYLPGGTALDSGLSVVNYSLLNASSPSSPEKSVVMVSYTHNTESFSTGSPKTLSTANGVTISGQIPGPITSNFGEFSTSTGLFTATRAGYYQFNSFVTVTTGGVTFNGASLLANAGSASSGALGSSSFCTVVAGNTFVQANLSGLIYCSVGATAGLSVALTFSAGAPVINSGYFSLTGPL